MDPFATLGLPRRYEIDVQQLDSRYRELQRALHPDKHAGTSASERRMSLLKAVEVNEAYRTLKDELRRAESLLALCGAGGEQRAEDPEFLLEVLELREALGEAKDARDVARAKVLAGQVERAQQSAREQLGAALHALPDAPAADELAKAAALVGRLRYFRRFLDEVSVIEEEALG